MKLLVAVDGSAQALEAARYALRLCEAGLKAEIVLATVQEPTFLYEMVLPPTSDVLERASGAVGHRALGDAEALFREAGVPFEIEIGSGEIAPTLLSIAQARCGRCGRTLRVATLKLACAPAAQRIPNSPSSGDWAAPRWR